MNKSNNINNDKMSKIDIENKMAMENLPLVGYVASKQFNNCGLSFDELVSIGYVGYAKALKKFDTKQNTKFATFAIHCIKNEILFNLRKEKKHFINDISFNFILSQDKNGNNLELEETIAKEDDGKKALEELVVENDNKEILMKCIKELTEKEQYILIHRYGLNNCSRLTQREIAEQIGMSQANISKIEKNLLKKLEFLLTMNNYSYN